VRERVSVLVPVRDEAANVQRCVRAVLGSQGLTDLEVLVLDDGSSDGTAELVRSLTVDEPRAHLLEDDHELPPDGWLGKPWACARLATAATGSVLVFLDADVVVEPAGIAAAVGLLRDSGLQLVSPYPRQDAVTASERLVQPLLQWSWLTTLPLRVAERSARPSMAAANGQLLVVDAAAYHRCGGHGSLSVRGAVIEDVQLLRAVMASGGRGTVVDGTQVARCRMYAGWPALRSGYTKSLWTAFGSPAGGLAVAAAASLVYLLPALAALAGSPVGAVGYAAAVTGRVLVGRRVGSRVWPDALAHPLSVAVFGVLVVDSVRRRRTGSLTWRGRPLR
jgi:glycosyltransferase involved in cell wall biosynthesis